MKSLRTKQVFCDFDGTVTSVDAVDAILNEFANDEWKEWETLWKVGEISARECLTQQVKLIRATREELIHFSLCLPVDPGFITLVETCRAHGIPLTLVSDGFDVVIEATLRRLELAPIPFHANHL